MVSDAPSDFAEAVPAFDRQAAAMQAAAAQEQSKQIRASFPLEEWPSLSVERYALGLPDSKSSFCYQLEFGSPDLGSIRGGSARKLIIYARQDGSGWFHDPAFSTIEEAWHALRAGFVDAFELTAQGRIEEVDDLEALRSGPALTAKSLYLYFPDELLPIYAQAHLRQFLEHYVGEKPPPLNPLAANRRLLELVRADPRFDGWNGIEVMQFFYWWADPRSAPAIVKIAPGERGRLWPECRDGGYICVGWDDVGDLSTFDSQEDFRRAFAAAFPYNGNQSTITRKAAELWRLTLLQPGDRVVANEGQSKVLAVGTVVEPGYTWRPDRAEYKHTVAVQWDESYARTLPEPVKRWAVTTVADVPGTLWRRLTGELPAIAQPTPGVGSAAAAAVLATADRQLQAIAKEMDRKGQVVLFGPPGTGKTYTAVRFAVWWLARGTGLDPLADYGTAEFRAVLATLSNAPGGSAAWWMVANPAQWSWDRLWADGRVNFRTGRIAENYTRIRPGDLVFCYEASPVRRIVGLARVNAVEPTEPEPVQLRPETRVANGPGWAQLSQDRLLADSEPVANRTQGTLFALTAPEAARLFELLGPDQDATGAEGADEGVGQLTQVTFHPSYGYEDFIEGFRPVPAPGGGLNLRLVDGIFKRVCRAAAADPDHPYLVVVDEINRGNIPKIFGELITLLEPDKRGLQVRLPQSGQRFTIPSNVFVLATMNTADRSIRLLDAALRRRFGFLELLPDTEPLDGAFVGKVHLAELLTSLNARIRAEVGRDRQLGQSFLLRNGEPVSTDEELAEAIRGDVIPLLQEYAYDDYGLLARVLGPKVIDESLQQVRPLVDGDLAEALYAELLTTPGDPVSL